ncbi:MAG: MarP family serine protease [Egibacteraceae bacterium]
MDGAGWNLVDLVLALLLLYGLVRGFNQGALSQVAAFGGAGLGLFAGARFAPTLAGLFVNGPGPSLALLTLMLLLAAVGISQAVGATIGARLAHAVARAGAGGLDRTAGMAVGAAGLVVVVWLFASVLVQGPLPVVAQQVRESRVVAVLDQALPPPPDVFGRVATYLDQQGFPQVVGGMNGGVTAPPVAPTSDEAVQAAAGAAQPSTVQVQALGCGGISSGSGFVTQTGFVVTNAHVVAGGERLQVRDSEGQHDAVTVLFDPALDLAVLSAPSTAAAPLGWVSTPSERETEGATLGFPGGQRELTVKPATVRSRTQAVGRDIYGGGRAEREILTLAADVRQGDSGGPFVTSEGLVGGVVFAANPAEPGSGYALTAERVRPDVAAAISANSAVGTGDCRFSG